MIETAALVSFSRRSGLFDRQPPTQALSGPLVIRLNLDSLAVMLVGQRHLTETMIGVGHAHIRYCQVGGQPLRDPELLQSVAKIFLRVVDVAEVEIRPRVCRVENDRLLVRLSGRVEIAPFSQHLSKRLMQFAIERLKVEPLADLVEVFW
jgi:hypothetical protein